MSIFVKKGDNFIKMVDLLDRSRPTNCIDGEYFQLGEMLTPPGHEDRILTHKERIAAVLGGERRGKGMLGRKRR